MKVRDYDYGYGMKVLIRTADEKVEAGRKQYLEDERRLRCLIRATRYAFKTEESFRQWLKQNQLLTWRPR
jgi:hypothetical protein